MSRFEVHEFAFDLPGTGWEEHTVNFFQHASTAQLPSLTITRDPGAVGSPVEIAERAIDRLLEGNQGVRVAGIRDSAVGPLPAREVLLCFGEGAPDGPIVQQLVYFSYYGAAMSVGVMAPAVDERVADEMTRRIVDETRLRRR